MNKIFSRYMKEFGVTEDFLIGFIRNFSGIDQKLIKNKFSRMVDDISWSDIIRFAHKLAPSVYTWLGRNGLSLNIPAERKNLFLITYLTTIEKNTRLIKEMAQVAGQFKKANLGFVFLKGAALLTSLYKEDIGLRPMADLDILLEKNDILSGEEILKSLGYTRVDPSELYIHHIEYIKGDIEIELHWDIEFGLSDYLLSSFFTEIRADCAGKTEINILRPEDNIFIALVNIHRDLYNTLGTPQWFERKEDRKRALYYILQSLYEIHLMVTRYADDISWKRFSLFAEVSKSEHTALSFLFLAKKIAGFHVPESVFQRAKKDISFNLFTKVCRRIDDKNVIGLFLVREFFYRFKDLSRSDSLANFINKTQRLADIFLFICSVRLYRFVRFLVASVHKLLRRPIHFK